MVIYSNNQDRDSEQILYSDIKFLTKQLGDFINVYETKIYIESQKDRDALNKLKIIYQKLKDERFNELINDTSIICYDDDDDGIIPFDI